VNCPDPSCNGHGYCANASCVCEPEWTSFDCTIKQCPNNCTGPDRGTCRYENGEPIACECVEGWQGSDCSVGKFRCLNLRPKSLKIYVSFHLMLKYVLLGLYYKQRLLFMKLRVLTADLFFLTIAANVAFRLLTAQPTPCDKRLTCDECTSTGACGWCETSGLCIDGDTVGPADGTGCRAYHHLSCPSKSCTLLKLYCLGCVI
jgi:hypothetical protein